MVRGKYKGGSGHLWSTRPWDRLECREEGCLMILSQRRHSYHWWLLPLPERWHHTQQLPWLVDFTRIRGDGSVMTTWKGRHLPQITKLEGSDADVCNTLTNPWAEHFQWRDSVLCYSKDCWAGVPLEKDCQKVFRLHCRHLGDLWGRERRAQNLGFRSHPPQTTHFSCTQWPRMTINFTNASSAETKQNEFENLWFVPNPNMYGGGSWSLDAFSRHTPTPYIYIFLISYSLSISWG